VERELPGARRQEPVRRRRRAVRLERAQELHVDDPGAGDADRRAHCAVAQSRNAMTRRTDHRRSDASGTRISRRRALAWLTAAPVAAMTWTNAEAEQAHEHATQARALAQPATAYKRKFFTAHEYATVGNLVHLVIPREARSH